MNTLIRRLALIALTPLTLIALMAVIVVGGFICAVFAASEVARDLLRKFW